jgi:hypothetical protein
MAYERAGLGTAVIDPSSLCPAGQMMEYAGTRSERCVPMVGAQTASSQCPAGQVRAFSADGSVCAPACSSHVCPGGKTKVDVRTSIIATTREQRSAQTQAMYSRGCTIAGCSHGMQAITGSSVQTWCCPPQSTPVAPPPPPSIVTQTVQRGPGPLFWIGLGAVGVGLFLVLRGRS